MGDRLGSVVVCVFIVYTRIIPIRCFDENNVYRIISLLRFKFRDRPVVSRFEPSTEPYRMSVIDDRFVIVRCPNTYNPPTNYVP